MRLFKLLFLSLVIAGISACNSTQKQSAEADNVQYYRHIQFTETPWDIEKGTHQISADEAKSVNNYKFTYDDSGRLLSIEYNRNGTLLDYGSIGAAKIEYTHDGNKQIKKFYDKEGNAAKRQGVSIFEYTLNEDGMRVALRFLDENGEPVENRNNIHNYKWEQLEDGMIREVRFNLAGEDVIMNPFCPFYELRFTYDDNGYMVRMANYEADTLYNCTAENCGDIGVSYFLFDNNENGDVESFSVHNTTGQLSNLYWGWAKRVSVYDENGYALETTQYDQDDEYLGGRRLPITRSEYNEHGALVKRITLDKNKNVANSPDNGVAIVEYKYDEAGRRIETLQYDKDGNPVTNQG